MSATGEVLLGELTQLELQVSQHVAGAAITSNQSSAVDNTSALHHKRDIQIKSTTEELFGLCHLIDV